MDTKNKETEKKRKKQERRYPDDSGLKEPRHSENVLAEMPCDGLYRGKRHRYSTSRRKRLTDFLSTTPIYR